MVAQIDRDYVRVTRSRAFVRLASYGLFEGRPPTTRGRFLNRLVFAQLKAASSHWAAHAVRQPVFVVGIGRSGTTLLGRLLSTHRQVGFLNEPRAMWQLILPEHDVSGFYGDTGRYLLTADDASDEVCETARSLYSWYAASTRSSRVVDKYPELIYRIPFVRQLFSDALFVAIVRAPGATVRSIGTWSEQHGTGGADWWGVRNVKWSNMQKELVPRHPDIESLLQMRIQATDEDRATVEWVLGMREVAQARDAGLLASFVRYEDLVAQPDQVLRRVLSELDLPLDQRVLTYAKGVITPTPTSLTRESLTQFGVWAEPVAETARALGYQF